MRISIDYQIFGSQARGGISRYFIELARHLAELDDCAVEILAPAYVTTGLRRSAPGLLAPGAVYDWLARIAAGPVFRGAAGVTRREASLRRLVNQRVSRWRLSQSEPDILHETFFEQHPLPLERARRVMTVQDMIDELLLLETGRTALSFVEAKRAAILRADHVICASERTRQDLLSLLPIPEANTTVVHHGCRSADEWPATAGAPVRRRPFLLFVGSRDTYKNFEGLLRAYALAPRLGREFALLAFGGGPFTARERQLATQLGVPDANLLQTDGDDRTLADLYRQAHLCVYPSMYEGFGFVPLEAMTFGCPVVTTHSGSLEEVAADAAQIVDPGEPESIAAGLDVAAFDEARRRQLTAAGFARASLFTWDKCAIGTRAVYERLLGHARS